MTGLPNSIHKGFVVDACVDVEEIVDGGEVNVAGWRAWPDCRDHARMRLS
jgi:hypothetical protein